MKSPPPQTDIYFLIHAIQKNVEIFKIIFHRKKKKNTSSMKKFSKIPSREVKKYSKTTVDFYPKFSKTKQQ